LSSPVADRGWCYEEDVLSLRIAKFTLSQVEWQCPGDEKMMERKQGLQMENHEPYRWFTIWYRFVKQYSTKQLTYAKDKLYVFSGIAANKSRANAYYLVGIWEIDIWAGLLWTRDTGLYPGQPGRRYSDYVAPS